MKERALLWLAIGAPGVLGVVALITLWGFLDLLKLAAVLATAPYLLGGYELYKGWAIRRTQRAALSLIPAALEAADRLIPQLLRDGMSGDVLRDRVKQELAKATGADWSKAEKDTLLDAVLEEAWKKFDPRALLDRSIERIA